MSIQLEHLQESKEVYGSGGFGDSLIILNKFTRIMKEFKFVPKLHKYFTDQEKTATLVRELFSLNDIFVEVKVVQSLEKSILEAKQDPNNFILTTVWNGILDQEDLAKGIFYSDEVAIQPMFEIKGVMPSTLPLPPHIVIQLDAGLIFHNPRKHWENVNLVIDLGRKLIQRRDIKVAVIGCPAGIRLPEEFINLDKVGFESIEWFKTAKLAIVLSGFVTFACLMNGVKTIMKVENKRVQERWFGVPEWQELIVPIDEIKTDINKIVEMFDVTFK